MSSISSKGRVSRKPWKAIQSATRRTHVAQDCTSTRWHKRLEQTKKQKAVKLLEMEMKETQSSELRRRKEVALERKRIAQEKQDIEQLRQAMSTKKMLRLRRKRGKKING